MSKLRNFFDGENIYKSSFKSLMQLKAKSESLPPLEQIMGKYIMSDSLVHFPAERGTGKTFLGLQVCIGVSSCWKSIYGELIEKHGNALFVNFELSEDIMSRRVGRLFDNPPWPIDQSTYQCHIYTTRSGLYDELINIVGFMKELKPVLVVLDNYRMAFINSDVNNNKEVTAAMNEILMLKDAMKATILLTDHTRKHSGDLLTDSDLQSGSGAKSDLVDSDMFLRRSSQDKYYRILKRMKSRNGEEDDGAKLLELNPDTLWFECIDDNINEEDHLGNNVIQDKEEKKRIAKELNKKSTSEREIAKLLNVGKSTVNRWLKE